MSTATRNGFEVAPAALTGSAGSFEAEAETLIEAATSLRKALGTMGPCWGRDDVGGQFAKDYRPPADTVLDNVESLAIGLGRIAAALRAVANAYDMGENDLLKPRAVVGR